MKIILVALLCCLTLHILEASPVKNSKEPYESKAQKFCKPGDVVEIAGLKCHCTELPKGVFWTCEGHFEREVQTYSVNQCTPGTTFKIDCNTCFCGENGVSACTDMFCMHESVQIKPSSANTDSECTPGTTFNIDCNSCFCTDSGMAACTRMLCDEDIVEVKPSSALIEKKKELCTPGEVVEIAGLKCKCKEIPHGMSWTCEGHFEKQVQTYSANKCTPGTTFKVECNSCFCNDNGMSACTLMECPHIAIPYDVDLPHFKHEHTLCQVGETSIQGGKQCKCVDVGVGHGWICDVNAKVETYSKKDLCTPGEIVEIAGLRCECKEIPHGITWTCEGHFEKQVQTYSANKCTPGTTFKAECNTCFCGDNGMAACTLMECPRMVIADIDSPEFRCEAGVPFKHPDGCNKCRCSADGKLAGCTRMFCPVKQTYSSVSDVFSPEFKCEPNTAFSHPDGCNTCTCDSAGRTNGCTRMMCPYSAKIASPAEDIKDLPNLNTSAPDFKCTPGMRFRDDCNLCRCTGNGMAACTDMACPKM